MGETSPRGALISDCTFMLCGAICCTWSPGLTHGLDRILPFWKQLAHFELNNFFQIGLSPILPQRLALTRLHFCVMAGSDRSLFYEMLASSQSLTHLFVNDMGIASIISTPAKRLQFTTALARLAPKLTEFGFISISGDFVGENFLPAMPLLSSMTIGLQQMATTDLLDSFPRLRSLALRLWFTSDPAQLALAFTLRLDHLEDHLRANKLALSSIDILTNNVDLTRTVVGRGTIGDTLRQHAIQLEVIESNEWSLASM